MKVIFKYIKRFILGVFMLYAYNLIISNIGEFNIIMPINLFTIVAVGLFDIPGLLALVILKQVGL